LNPAVLTLLVVLVAAALAAASYLAGGRPERALWPAVAGRAVSWTALGLLLLNVGCPTTVREEQPLVLVDVSPSMDAPGGQGAEAGRMAAGLGEVLEFRGSRLIDPLTAAVASGRRIVVLTDGEIVDAGGLSAAVLAGTEVRVLPRQVQADVAITGVEGPRHLARGDSLAFEVDLRIVGDSAPGGMAIEAVANEVVLGRVEVPSLAGERQRLRVPAGAVALGPGQHLIEMRLVGGGDAEPRTDRRLHHLTVSETPGIILVANPASWDSRFLYRTLAEVAGLPVEGFLQLEPGSWRRISDLRPVSASVVQQGIQGADLLVTFGGEPAGAAQSRARGRWLWPDRGGADGDWYLDPDAGSPLAGAFAGVSSDSLLPADGLIPMDLPPGSWTALSARLGRRGAPRPALVGSEGPSGRRLTVAATGLWRWAFQGGIQEQVYRSWVASSVTWLLGRTQGVDAGLAQPVRPVVERDEPIVFQWTGPDAPTELPITLMASDSSRTDTLRFDGAGRATLPLGVGGWQYTLAGGGSGLIAVEAYSSELLPGPVTLEAREAARSPARGTRGSRELPWLFALAVLGWCVEWTVRRRAGRR